LFPPPPPPPPPGAAGGAPPKVEDMCYERLRAEAYVNESAHRALVNAGERDIV